jgi:hypothetical protein
MTANSLFRIFTIEIGDTPTLTFEAQNMREAQELCHLSASVSIMATGIMHKSELRPLSFLDEDRSGERFSRLDVFGIVSAAPAHGTPRKTASVSTQRLGRFYFKICPVVYCDQNLVRF